MVFRISWYYLVFFAGTEIPFLFAVKWLMLRFRGFELQIGMELGYERKVRERVLKVPLYFT